MITLNHFVSTKHLATRSIRSDLLFMLYLQHIDVKLLRGRGFLLLKGLGLHTVATLLTNQDQVFNNVVVSCRSGSLTHHNCPPLLPLNIQYRYNLSESPCCLFWLGAFCMKATLDKTFLWETGVVTSRIQDYGPPDGRVWAKMRQFSWEKKWSFIYFNQGPKITTHK